MTALLTRSSSRPTRLLLALSAGAMLLVSLRVVPALASHPASSSVQQQWELLAGAQTGITATKTIPIERGTVGGTALDPIPTMTLDVIGRVTGATGSTTTWTVELRTETSVIGSVQFGAGDTDYTYKSGTLSWLSVTQPLRSIRVEPVAHAPSIYGTFTLMKASLRLTQTGTVKKTTGRVPMTHAQTITSTSWADVADPILYEHRQQGFDPQPTIRLQVGADNYNNLGVPTADVRLVNAANSEITYLSFVGPPGTGSDTKVSEPIALAEGVKYRVQARSNKVGGWKLHSADLLFQQSTTDAHGLGSVVGWYPALTTPTDLTADGQTTKHLLAPVVADAEVTGASWITLLKRNTGTGTLRLNLVSASGSSLATGDAVSTSNYTFSSNTVQTSLPQSGTAWDSKLTLSAGTTGRAALSMLRISLRLRDTVTSLEANNPYFSPNGDISKDATTISGLIHPDAIAPSWHLKLRDSSNAVVKEFGGIGNQVLAVWDGAATSGGIAADGSYTATLTIDGLPKVQRPISLVVDTKPVDLQGMFPRDRQNTVYNTQPIQAGFSDLSGAEQVTMTLRDETAGTTVPLTVVLDPVAQIATGSLPLGTSLTDGHDYRAQLDITDRAGNMTTLGHTSFISPSDPASGGFRKIQIDATPSNAQIPSMNCPVETRGTARVAVCSQVEIALAEASAFLSSSRHGHTTGFITHNVSLQAATVRFGALEINAYENRAPIASEWSDRSTAFSYRVEDRADLPAWLPATPSPASTSVGTLEVTLPVSWNAATTVSLQMSTATTFLNAEDGLPNSGACRLPLTSDARPCATDPAWSRWAVVVAPGMNVEQIAAAHASQHGADIAYVWNQLPEVHLSYEATLSPKARSEIADDPSVVRMVPARTRNVEDHYSQLLDLPESEPTVTGTTLGWTHASEGTSQQISLEPTQYSTVTRTTELREPSTEGGQEGQLNGMLNVDTLGLRPSGDLVAASAASGTSMRRARYESSDGSYWIEAQPAGSSGLQFVVMLLAPTAPTSYEFAMTLPTGTTLDVFGNEAVIVRQHSTSPDQLVGHIAAPVAWDAHGRPVDVTQTIEAARIVLTISPSTENVFPIVADPKYEALECVRGDQFGEAAEYLRGEFNRCPYGITFVWARYFFPVRSYACVGNLCPKNVRRDGECSTPIVAVNETWWYDFTVPCQMHDYGYDLLRVKDPFSYREIDKLEVDGEFRIAMTEHCQSRTPEDWGDCFITAGTFYGFVSVGCAACPGDKYAQPQGPWPDTQLLLSNDFLGDNRIWDKTGTHNSNAGIRWNDNLQLAYYFLRCDSSPCGLKQDAIPVPGLYGGEDFRAAVGLDCDVAHCEFELIVEGLRRRDDKWIHFNSAQHFVEDTGNFTYFNFNMDAFVDVEEFSEIRWWIQTEDTSDRLRIYIPRLTLLPDQP